MAYACSPCQPTRTRRPLCSSASCEDISKVLADDLKLAPLVQLDHEAGDHPDVRDVADAALLDP